MNSETAVLRAQTAGGRDGGAPGLPVSAARRRHSPQAVYGMGLWVFMGVATALFMLFFAAYVMRLGEPDAVTIRMPPQLWLSTTWLAVAGLLMQHSATSMREYRPARARLSLRLAGLCALAFFGTQWWAWHALLSQDVTPTGNPAGSFFYLLTTMHGLHVAGGIVAWGVVAHAARKGHDLAGAGWRIALCARYWHFLLAVWLFLFFALSVVTPDVARFICRTG